MKNLEKLTQKKLDELLMDDSTIDRAKLEECIHVVNASSGSGSSSLADMLLNRGIASEDTLAQVLANRLQLPYLSLANWTLTPDLFKRIPKNLMHKYQFIPLDQIEDIMTVMISGVPSVEMVDEVQLVTQSDIYLYIGTITDVREALKLHATMDQEEKVAEAAAEAEKSATPKGDMTAGWESIFDIGDESVKKELQEKASSIGLFGTKDNEFEDFMASASSAAEPSAANNEFELAANTNLGLVGMSESQFVSQSDLNYDTNATDAKAEATQGPVDDAPSDQAQRVELAQLTEHLAKNPNDYDMINQYIKLALELGDVKAAVRQLTKFAWNLDQTGKSAEADDCYQYILELDPNNREAKKRLKKS